MGLSLNLIKEILTKYADKAGLKTYLEIQTIGQKEKIEHMQKQLNLLETTIANLDHTSDIPLYSVALKRIPAHYVISVRGIIKTPDKEAELWEKLEQETKNSIYQSGVEFSLRFELWIMFHAFGWALSRLRGRSGESALQNSKMQSGA